MAGAFDALGRPTADTMICLSDRFNQKIAPGLILIIALVLAVLAPAIAPTANHSSAMTMYDNDHVAMEREVLKRLPPGTNVQQIEQVMGRNGFTPANGGPQTNSYLRFEKEESTWLTHEGTLWTVEIDLQRDTLADVKVWIEPSD